MPLCRFGGRVEVLFRVGLSPPFPLVALDGESTTSKDHQTWRKQRNCIFTFVYTDSLHLCIFEYATGLVILSGESKRKG